MDKTSRIGGLAVALLSGLLAMKGSGFLGGKIRVENPAVWSDRAASVPTTSDDAMWGSRDAPVTLVIFSDYLCPFCQKLESTVEELKQKYGPYDLRIVFKHAPIVHEKAVGAHIAAAKVLMLGGTDKFWRFHAHAFEQGDASPETLTGWAKDLGIDPTQFNDAELTRRATEKVATDIALAKEGLGLRAFPASFVNGITVRGAKRAPEFEKIIDAQLDEARALRAQGMRADEIYVALSSKNHAAPTGPAPPKSPAPNASGEPSDPESDEPPPADTPKEGAKGPSEDSLKVRIDVGTSPVRGPMDAVATIVEFGNFECPFTSQATGTLKEVEAQYAGKVRVVFKHRPLSYRMRGTAASVVAEMAHLDKGNEAFWAAHDALFALERSAHAANNGDPFSVDALVKIGTDVGLDGAAVREAVTDADPSTPSYDAPPAAQKYMAVIEADGEIAEELDAEATPQFFVNGKRINGAQPAEKFAKVIDNELGSAQALLDKGVAPAKLYEEIMATVKPPPAPAIKLIERAPEGAPWRGAEGAKVELHIFSDFQCPFCRQVGTTLQVLEKLYEKEVRFVWRDRPISKHDLAPMASNAAHEAMAQRGNDAFWAFHDELFKLDPKVDFNRAGFEKIAEKQGLDMSAFKAALDSNKHQQVIDAEVARADRYGIASTPGFVITFAEHDGQLEGFHTSGAIAPSKFKRLIRLALAIADGSKPVPAP